MTLSANLGFPRIGARRELKSALEAHWAGKTSSDALLTSAAQLRARHWTLQKDAGISIIPSNDFSLYDHVLDTSIMLGAVPSRFQGLRDGDPLELYFACARGLPSAQAMEMTKWFDTNYHYIVPEFEPGQTFSLSSSKVIEHYLEAKALGIETRPILLGPVSWLSLGKAKGDFAPISLIKDVIPVYAELLSALKAAGASAVQIDEPVLVLDLDDAQQKAFDIAYRVLGPVAPEIMLTNYFGTLGDNIALAARLPVAGLHIDLCRAPEQLDPVLAAIGDQSKALSLGLVDGRNIWRADLDGKLALANRAAERIGAERLHIAPSCSLLHCPIDLEHETALDSEALGWLAFARQKLDEIQALALAVEGGEAAARKAFAASREALASRNASTRIHNAAVKSRLAGAAQGSLARQSPFVQRAKIQADRFALPAFPTTTIGSFPQTGDVRKARAAHNRAEIDEAAYETFLREKTAECIRIQEELGLDVLVHGEFERNDMVQYFGEQLDGFFITQNGWVQSYGSRCVKPPVIFGDVSRPAPMTVKWSAFAQSLTSRPVKGMVTGPVTILQWSFVRDDQPRSQTCRQIALAIRDEVLDLERAGIAMIQIDEPALREGLPLRRADWTDYLGWAVDCFRLSASGVKDTTPIHTHMCYAEFNDIMEAIAALDADVISIETSRSDMELLEAFSDFSYPNAIGPGVWDIHSPRVPDIGEMEALLERALVFVPAERLWVNPDCGLKTRGWPEVKAALETMVRATSTLRSRAA